MVCAKEFYSLVQIVNHQQGRNINIGLRETFCSFVKVTFPMFQKVTFAAFQPIERQSRLQQTTNFATSFLFFKKIRYDIS